MTNKERLKEIADTKKDIAMYEAAQKILHSVHEAKLDDKYLEPLYSFFNGKSMEENKKEFFEIFDPSDPRVKAALHVTKYFMRELSQFK